MLRNATRRWSCFCTKRWGRSRCGAISRSGCAMPAGFAGCSIRGHGHGGSTARERWPLDYLECEARQLLPDFLRAVGADVPALALRP